MLLAPAIIYWWYHNNTCHYLSWKSAKWYQRSCADKLYYWKIQHIEDLQKKISDAENLMICATTTRLTDLVLSTLLWLVAELVVHVVRNFLCQKLWTELWPLLWLNFQYISLPVQLCLNPLLAWSLTNFKSTRSGFCIPTGSLAILVFSLWWYNFFQYQSLSDWMQQKWLILIGRFPQIFQECTSCAYHQGVLLCWILAAL